MTTYKLAAIGLGSNRDAQNNVSRAQALCQALPQTRSIGCSRLYTTQPWGGAAAGLYVNAVVAVETQLTPWQLLAQTQRIERQLGRVRGPHYGSRCIDLDVLWYQNAQLSTSWLTLPHPQLLNRRFALEPLVEILPDICVARGVRARVALWHLVRAK